MKELGTGGEPGKVASTVAGEVAGASGSPLDLLRGENARLREQLDSAQEQLSGLRTQFDRLLSEARLNQAKLRRFDQIERQLIAAPSLTALVQALLVDFGVLFELDAVTLALVDPQYEAARVLSEGWSESAQAALDDAETQNQTQTSAEPPAASLASLASRDSRSERHATEPSAGTDWFARLLLLGSGQLLSQIYTRGWRPMLGSPDPNQAALFQGVNVRGLGSTALLPLLHRGECIGSLNLGSRDSARFSAGNSTDFLERLAALAAICLDNALVAERLKLVGLTDALTGVHNRRYFEARCLEEVKAAQRSRQPLVCLLLDVDHFKRINDNHGHPAGDAVLREVGQVIRGQLRGNDVVARYGGEEFVLLLPNTPLQGGVETADRIRLAIASAAMPVQTEQDTPLHITVSLGAAQMDMEERKPVAEAGDAAPRRSTPVESMKRLVQQADQALYAAKQAGRNRVQSAQ
ncbi:GGDEF domain-containing protein [Hylemonella gracilis]|uniref:diguanylate cyclase n=1 Tax=Hylemonella gracilis ATCC 19624 TaxID=887062 RepID=F3KRV2_9BURK|nr:sensor domain-containing diguanylate cyclase [Hylemonella gracilis]EGI77504.1 diguanylate cyclase with GAF sensor [Hylemonella gracilis ATCC 19624]